MKNTPDICRKIPYCDDKGREIVVFEPIGGSPVKHMALLNVSVRVAEGELRRSHWFTIPASSVADAFDALDAQAKIAAIEAQDAMMAEYRRSKNAIVTAGAVPPVNGNGRH